MQRECFPLKADYGGSFGFPSWEAGKVREAGCGLQELWGAGQGRENFERVLSKVDGGQEEGVIKPKPGEFLGEEKLNEVVSDSPDLIGEAMRKDSDLPLQDFSPREKYRSGEAAFATGKAKETAGVCPSIEKGRERGKGWESHGIQDSPRDGEARKKDVGQTRERKILVDAKGEAFVVKGDGHPMGRMEPKGDERCGGIQMSKVPSGAGEMAEKGHAKQNSDMPWSQGEKTSLSVFRGLVGTKAGEPNLPAYNAFSSPGPEVGEPTRGPQLRADDFTAMEDHLKALFKEEGPEPGKLKGWLEGKIRSGEDSRVRAAAQDEKGAPWTKDIGQKEAMRESATGVENTEETARGMFGRQDRDLGRIRGRLEGKIRSGEDSRVRAAAQDEKGAPWTKDMGQKASRGNADSRVEAKEGLIREGVGYDQCPKVAGTGEMGPSGPEPASSSPGFQSAERACAAAGMVKNANFAQEVHPGENLGQIIEKAVTGFRDGHKEIKIELKPEILGHLRLKIFTNHHQVAVRIITDTPMAKEMIEGNMHELREGLQNHGLEISKFDVMLSANSQENCQDHKEGFSSPPFAEREGEEDVGEAGTERDDQDLHVLEEKAGSGCVNVFA